MPLTQTQLATAVAERAEITGVEAKRVLGALEEIVLEELRTRRRSVSAVLCSSPFGSSRRKRSARAETRLPARKSRSPPSPRASTFVRDRSRRPRPRCRRCRKRADDSPPETLSGADQRSDPPSDGVAQYDRVMSLGNLRVKRTSSAELRASLRRPVAHLVNSPVGQRRSLAWRVGPLRSAAPAETQPTRARSLTIRRLLVRASSRSIAETTASSRGGLIDQRFPTRWTSPRRSRSCSRASALSLLRPAARAAVAVENESGSLRSAARSRSGLSSVRRSSVRGVGGESVSVAAGAGSGAGLFVVGGSSPKRARQLPHNTTGSRPAGRTISNRRHLRPEWQTPQRRPARSISVRSSTLIGSLYLIIGREPRTAAASRG